MISACPLSFVSDGRLLCFDGSAEFPRGYIRPDRRTDHNPDLIKMPNIAWSSTPATQLSRKCNPEFQDPAAERFILDNDPPFEQHFLDQSEAQGEAKIQPHSMHDQFARKTVTFVADSWSTHAAQSTAQKLM
jgi:hypothetical protein